MTAEHLVAVIGHLRVASERDEVLIRALQTELSFRQAGIRKELARRENYAGLSSAAGTVGGSSEPTEVGGAVTPEYGELGDDAESSGDDQVWAVADDDYEWIA